MRETRKEGTLGTQGTEGLLASPARPPGAQGRPASEAAGAMPREAAGMKASCRRHRREQRQALPSLSPDPNW